MVKTKGFNIVKVKGTVLEALQLNDPASFARSKDSISFVVGMYSIPLGEKKAIEYIGSILNSVEDLAYKKQNDLQSAVNDTLEHLIFGYRIYARKPADKGVAILILAAIQDHLNSALIPGYKRLL
jgi:hypothetical protein